MSVVWNKVTEKKIIITNEGRVHAILLLRIILLTFIHMKFLIIWICLIWCESETIDGLTTSVTIKLFVFWVRNRNPNCVKCLTFYWIKMIFSPYNFHMNNLRQSIRFWRGMLFCQINSIPYMKRIKHFFVYLLD